MEAVPPYPGVAGRAAPAAQNILLKGTIPGASHTAPRDYGKRSRQLTRFFV
jgi:hypothetical protein